MGTWRIRVTVNRIVDGDTFDGDADLGWGVWRKSIKGAPMRFRILGVDTPERGDPRWAEATAFLTSVLSGDVFVESMALDSFGRALCRVELPGGVDLRSLYPAEWQL